MKKQILIIRHAKAAESSISIRDFDRHLTKRGYKDAHTVGSAIKKKGIHVTLIVSSEAVRATETARLIREQLPISESSIIYDKNLYQASTRNLLELVNGLPNEHECVAIVAHNPTLAFFAEYLTNQEGIYLKTSGTLLITFKTEKWAEISQYSGTLEWQAKP